MKTLTLQIDDTVYGLLQVLTRDTGAATLLPDGVQGVIYELIDHAQQGIYRPGSWERSWLTQAFGDDWLQHLEAGDPYGRDDASSRRVYQRPRKED